MARYVLQGRDHKRAFAFILIMMTIDGVGGGLIVPAVPPLLIELTGRSAPLAAISGGWVTALFAAAQFVAAPVLGNLSDRYGRRPILIGSLAAFGIDYLVVGLAPTMIWLYCGAILLGAFSATFSTASAYVADVFPPEKRTEKIGQLLALAGVGAIFGPMLAGVLEGYGTRAPFFLAAFCALLNALHGLFVLPESLPEANRRPFSLPRANPAYELLHHARRSASVIGLLGALSLTQLATLTVPVIWGYFTILKFGWSQGDIGLSLSVLAAANVFTQSTLIRYISRRIGNLRTASTGFSCLFVGLLGFSVSANSWMLLGFILPTAFGSMVGTALIGHMTTHAAADSQGAFQGTLASVTSITMILTPLLMTQIFSFFSDAEAFVYFPGAPFAMAALFALTGLFLVRRTIRHETLTGHQLSWPQ